MSKHNDPLPPAELIGITDRESAEGQLETAITLWFEEKDFSSIHTLAVATQGVLNQMCKERGIRASVINDLIEAQSKTARSWIRSPQNFFKHGRHRQGRDKNVVVHIPILTELVLIDCASMYQRLFDSLTPLMMLFALRYSLFNPEAFPIKIDTEGIEIENLARLSRPDFLKKVLPRLRGKAGKLRPFPHSGNPPE